MTSMYLHLMSLFSTQLICVSFDTIYTLFWTHFSHLTSVSPYFHSLLKFSFLCSSWCPWSLNSRMFYISILVLLPIHPLFILSYMPSYGDDRPKFGSKVWISALNSRLGYLCTCDLYLISNDILKPKYEPLIYPPPKETISPLSYLNKFQSIH